MAREYGGRVVYFALGLVVDIVRSIPILVIIIWTFFGLPLILGIGTFSPFAAAVIALGVHSGVYIAEIVRGGLASVRAGQWQAGTRARDELVPCARGASSCRRRQSACCRRSAPASSATSRIPRSPRPSPRRNCSGRAIRMEGETARPFPIYTTLMIFYFLLNLGIARGIEQRLRAGRGPRAGVGSGGVVFDWPAFWDTFPALMPGLVVTIELAAPGHADGGGIRGSCSGADSAVRAAAVRRPSPPDGSNYGAPRRCCFSSIGCTT